ncbi:MAG: hypothetical protein LLG37_08885 [Spirochaetia bacterium]|nr:hypothetical protein [Spirochaetia bacterium]
MMRKTILPVFIIILVFLLLLVSSMIPNFKSSEWLYAWDASITPTSLAESFKPVVCWMNHQSPPPHTEYPPIGGVNDWTSWTGGTFISTLPPAQMTNCGVGNCGDDVNIPSGMYIRVTWAGKSLSSPHYIHLTNYANATGNRIGKLYENVGCYIDASSNPVTSVAGDMSCYDFVRFYYYFSFSANGGAATSVSQRAGLYDGNITLTAGAMNVNTQGAIVAEGWKYHYSMSLNFLANKYDVNTGRYFSVSNITDTIIYAPETDYAMWSKMPANYPTPGYNYVIVYYDHLTLGAGTSLPEYDSPAGITVTTAYGGSALPVAEGALLQWQPYANATPGYPVTAYHIYRAMTVGATGGDPFESVAIVPANVTTYVDTTVMGGDTYCYKILPAIQGPLGAGSLADQRYLTINANYHEALLNDPVAVVTQVCGWVDIRPTSTSTPTPYLGTPTMTATPGGPTVTETPVASVTGTRSVRDAHVYPNPFNPAAGTRTFYVGNVPPDENDHSKPSLSVSIYAMDGTLVKELTDTYYKPSRWRFEWDGKNQNGTRIVTGLYFVVLKPSGGSGENRVERLLVCYKCDPVYNP